MFTAEQFRAMARSARQAAAEYRAEAIGSHPERRYMLQQWAVSRDEHAEFYDREADYREAYELRAQIGEAA